jgi:hypothetical protein
MWTSRNLVALGMFLFGTAYLWLAAGRAPAPSGTACALTNVLAYVAVIGSAVAACGVFKQYSWWERAAVVSGVAGQSQFDVGFADFGGQINLWMHILGSAAVIGIVLVPVAHDGVTRCL